ncbi:MAG: ATP-binding protein [Candidatus Paceibacterota bacterium]
MSTTITELTPIPVKMHMGNVIGLLSQNYGSGFEIVREAVQNSIDEGATKIFISIHCTRGIIKIYDNGGGATRQEIEEKFNNIGLSSKRNDPDKMGCKGIGNLAGLSVAEEWQFISKKGNQPFILYTFNKKELIKGNDINLYAEELPIKQIDRDCPFEAKSLLRLIGVSEVTLKQLGNEEVIEKTLKEAFNVKLRMRNIELRVSYCDFKNKTKQFLVKPVKYRGAEMEVVSQDTPKGFVDFAFFHNPTPIQHPSILVRHQGVYSIPLGNFFKMKILPDRVEHLFSKGYFEGEIRLGFCTVNGARSAFNQDEDLKYFVEAVTTFAEDVLRPIIEQFEQADRQERWKRIAEGVLKTMRAHFQKNSTLIPPQLRATIFRSVDPKDQGAGSEDVGVKKTATSKKKTDRPNLAPDALKEQKKESERNRLSGGTGKQKTKIVDFSEGLGIQFIHPDPETDRFRWHSRTSKEGVIQVNVVNNEFLEAEKRGQSVMARYLMTLLHKELTCASLVPVDAKSFDAGFELMLESFYSSSF